LDSGKPIGMRDLPYLAKTRYWMMTPLDFEPPTICCGVGICAIGKALNRNGMSQLALYHLDLANEIVEHPSKFGQLAAHRRLQTLCCSGSVLTLWSWVRFSNG
jgi:hypothetical protein